MDLIFFTYKLKTNFLFVPKQILYFFKKKKPCFYLIKTDLIFLYKTIFLYVQKQIKFLFNESNQFSFIHQKQI